MNTVICGAGEVGRHVAEVFGGRGGNVTIIDHSAASLAQVEDLMDVRTLRGDGTHADVLREAGCAGADLFVAATQKDETNLLAASLAKAVGVRRCIARVHRSAYYEQRGINLKGHLQIDHLLCPEHSTAEVIAQTLRNPGALAVESFARGLIEMQQIAVSEDAPAVGKALRDVALPTSVRVGAVETIDGASIPDGATVIGAHDVVTLIGEVKRFEKARRLFSSEEFRRRRVVIVGGSVLAVWLCRALQSRVFAVKLLVADRARAEELAAKLSWVTVVRVDPTDPTAFDQERVDQADEFVAATDDDEQNILSAARAKSMGVPNAITVLHRSTYLHLVKHVGIDRAFSPRVTAVSQMLHMIDESPIRQLATLAEGIAEAYEVRVQERARAVGKALRDVGLPSHTLVAAILHADEEPYVPGANDVIRAGDTLVVLAPATALKPIRKLFV